MIFCVFATYVYSDLCLLSMFEMDAFLRRIEQVLIEQHGDLYHIFLSFPWLPSQYSMYDILYQYYRSTYYRYLSSLLATRYAFTIVRRI